MSTTTSSRPAQLADLRARLAELAPRDARRIGRTLGALPPHSDPTARDAALAAALAAIETAEARLAVRRANVPPVSYPEQLPITAARDEIAAAIRDHQVVIVAGETGSGKTTQLPKLCLDLGRGVRGMIGHTQPRRLAARTVAERIAEELDTPLGTAVGYQVRFTDRASDDTLVKLMTDGILLNEIQQDRLLDRYDTLIIDEAHERSLNIDFILGYLHGLLPRRPDLKVIITSATIDPERFARHFGGAPVVEVSGRMYPVEIRYRPLTVDGGTASDADDSDAEPSDARPVDDRDQAQGIRDAVHELIAEGQGDILVFLSGEREIRDTAEILTGEALPHTEILPLYARLSNAEQHRVFAPHTGRRIVLATNIAETSLTVPGIKYVIDTGTARVSRFSRRTKVQRLPIEPISQAAANQRAGRCGRLSGGICVRLYSENDFQARPEFTEPEILRTSLASVILRMAALGLGGDTGERDGGGRGGRGPRGRRRGRTPTPERPDANADTNANVETSANAGGNVNDAETGAETGAKTGAGDAAPAADFGASLAAFPFIDPPDRRAVADGIGLLEELGALDTRTHGLTPIGRKLSRLPIDPRFGRMLLEADRNGCVAEVLVIAAALSVQDPRDRPLDHQQAAKAAHARFADEGSDFVSFLNLWTYLREKQKELSGNQFRRTCRAEYLNYLRIREWQDLHGQLRQILRTLKINVNDLPAGHTPDTVRVHQSLLSGLLSHIGQKDPEKPEYAGARNARFSVSPGSALFRRPPRWVMAAELVETSKLWGRVVASFEPEWAEQLGAHLVKRTYSEPHWEKRAAAVMALEKVTLYGVPIVAARKVNYGRIDPELCRELFIRHGLVQGEWESHHRFLRHNRELLDQVAELEARSRRRGIVVDEETLFELYDARVGAEAISGRHFDTWWKKAKASQPDLLTFTLPMLMNQGTEPVSPDDYPETWRQDDVELPLSYQFEPGSEADGVTVRVPLARLNSLRPDGFDWHVPGLRLELATALIRTLPKQLRVNFVPAPDFAKAALEHADPDASLLDALERQLRQMTNITVPREAWQTDKLPEHLRVAFEVVDESGRTLARGRDLTALQRELRPRTRALMAQAADGLERDGLRGWDFGELPRTFTGQRHGHPITGYPALVDAGDSVAIRVCDTELLQRHAMRRGLRRLLVLSCPSPVRYVLGSLDNRTKLALGHNPYPDMPAFFDDCVACAVDALVTANGGVVWDQQAFGRLRDQVRADLAHLTLRVVRAVEPALSAAHAIRGQLDTLTGQLLEAARHDIENQLDELVGNGFVSGCGLDRLADLRRYTAAISRRLEKLRADPYRDAARIRQIAEVRQAYQRALAAQPPGQPVDDRLADVRWLIEELRVSYFAQSIGTRGSISEKRVLRAIDEAR